MHNLAKVPPLLMDEGGIPKGQISLRNNRKIAWRLFRDDVFKVYINSHRFQSNNFSPSLCIYTK